MAQPSPPPKPAARRLRGFEPAARLVATQIRSGTESRGFAVARLVTHWAEIVGPDIAARTRPVKVSHGKGFGATLTLLVGGAHAPLVQMQLPAIRDRVNACYGFNAIARIALTQTAARGFAEGQAQFGTPPLASPATTPATAATQAGAEIVAARFNDPTLSAAMRQLALNHLSRKDSPARKATP